MLQEAYRQGIKTIIATPHYRQGQDIEQLKELTGILRHEAQKLDPGYGIFLGQELMDSEEIVKELRSGRALTMAGSSFVLIEFLPGVSYSRLYQRLRQLQSAGYIPILAHAERYACLREEGRLGELKESGYLIQMNYRSLTGSMFNRNTQWCRRQILKENIHLLGTDMHNTGARAPHTMNYRSLTGSMFNRNTQWCRRQILKENIHLLGTDMHNTGARAPHTKEALSWLERHCSKRELYRMIKKYPECILNKKEGIAG